MMIFQELHFFIGIGQDCWMPPISSNTNQINRISFEKSLVRGTGDFCLWGWVKNLPKVSH
jgi:hypothetical protein